MIRLSQEAAKIDKSQVANLLSFLSSPFSLVHFALLARFSRNVRQYLLLFSKLDGI